MNCDYGNSSLYVFWKENQQSFFRKIDKCNFSQIEISNEIFRNYSEKIINITNESVKAYTLINNDSIEIRHSEFAKYYFVINGKLEVKVFDYFDLTSQSERQNLNYEFNHSLELVKLSKVCDKIILENQ